MAHIEIWTRDLDVENIYKLGSYTPQHAFLLKINDDGTRELLRGGPEENDINLLVVRQEYNGEAQDDNLALTYDWYDSTLPNTSHYQGKTIYTSTQSDIDARWNAAWNFGQQINNEHYLYEVITQNSNTVVGLLADQMGLRSHVEIFLNAEKDLFVPGLNSTLSHDTLDDGAHWAQEFLYEAQSTTSASLEAINAWMEEKSAIFTSQQKEADTSLANPYAIHFGTLDTLTLLAASHDLTLEELFNLPGNEALAGRIIEGDNGAELFLYGESDMIYLTPQDHDFDYALLSYGEIYYNPAIAPQESGDIAFDWGNEEDPLHTIFGDAYGEVENDRLDGSEGIDMLDGFLGDDQLYGWGGDDALIGGEGNDDLHGGSGEDDLSGNEGNDVLRGEEDRDFLYGGEGDDVLAGGAGADVLYGAEGRDIFVFDHLSDARVGIVDRVMDFSVVEDRFDFSALRVQGIESFSDIAITQDIAHNITILAANDPGDPTHTIDLAHITGLVDLNESHFMWG